MEGPCEGHDADNSRELQLLSRAQRDVLVDGLVYFMVPVLRPAVDAHFLREDWAVRRQGHAMGIIAGRRLGMAEVLYQMWEYNASSSMGAPTCKPGRHVVLAVRAHL